MIREFILNNKQIKFKIYNPGGNKTALVYDNNYTQNEISTINDYILVNYPQIEQVGFISKKDKQLKMAGGEFCANATRCAIYDFLSGNEDIIELSVSGCDSKLIGYIKDNSIYVKMDFKNLINKIRIELSDTIINGYKVNLDGIEHIVIDYLESKRYIDMLKDSEEKLKNKCKDIIQASNTTENAIGVIFLERQNTTTKIYPIVWVKSINTLYFETACGSGTIAAFTYLYNTEKIQSASILQPSNFELNVSLDNDTIILSGPVIEE